MYVPLCLLSSEIFFQIFVLVWENLKSIEEKLFFYWKKAHFLSAKHHLSPLKTGQNRGM